MIVRSYVKFTVIHSGDLDLRSAKMLKSVC